MTIALRFLRLLLPSCIILSPVLCRGDDEGQGEGYRWLNLAVPAAGRTGFTRLALETTGVAFTNLLSEAAIAANRVLPNGSGVALGDYDGDCLPDIYLCGLESSNALFRNLGQWRFEDVTAEAGVACAGRICRGAAFVDINGDGALDLLVSTLANGLACFINDGAGGFTETTASSGTASRYGSMSFALADVDGNGTIDLYVANNRPDDIRDRGRVDVRIVNGQPVLPSGERDRLTIRDGQLLEYGHPDQLLLNDGTGRFRAVSWTDGRFRDEDGEPLAAPPLDWGLTATFRDVNGDGAPDLYVCNDFWTPDRFWINDGVGGFEMIAREALPKTSASSMGVDFSDLDRDGHLDFIIVDMLSRSAELRKRQMPAQRTDNMPATLVGSRPQLMRNTLFRNTGDGRYQELAYFAGLAASDWSWTALFLDADLDGDDDLLAPAGHFRDVQDLDAADLIRSRQHPWKGSANDAARQRAFTRELMEHYRLYPRLNMPVVAFENKGDWHFEERTEAWTLTEPGVHQGIATADFDGDGDLDFVVNNLNGLAGIYRNETIQPRVHVRLQGKAPNTGGIGATVTLRGGAVPVQTVEIIAGGRYLSGGEMAAAFAAGSADNVMSLEVEWRDGGRQSIAGVRANRGYVIEQRAEVVQGPPPPRVPPPALFDDVTALLGHVHHESAFNDFQRQPLLPFKQSQNGPGVAWADLDDDGQDELIVGTGRGGQPAVFRQQSDGSFSGVPVADFAAADDMAGLVGWAGQDGQPSLLYAVTGYEEGGEETLRSLRLDTGTVVEEVESGTGGASGLAVGPLHGEGSLSLFVGGGVVPGAYPHGRPSSILVRRNNSWRLDETNSRLLQNLGIVNGGLWSDLNGDGLPELVLACEWGSIRIFQNEQGKLFDRTESWGLSRYRGWWKSVTSGDFDGDGRMDLAAANWGLNSPYRASDAAPLVFVHGQLFQPGITEVLETEYADGGNGLVPRLRWTELGRSLPFVMERFTTHESYSRATVDQVLGPRTALGRRVEVNWLESTVFLNRGDRFEAFPLPWQAQVAPAFSVHAADLNGDGNEDLFLSQNFFATRQGLSRLDAGAGLVLIGKGTGQFEALPGHQSGVVILGEQRGAALADFNRDGRVDLAVTQNGEATRLFRNRRAKPGLRVRLTGPASNPHGVGATMRLHFKEGAGPAREIHGGSGYWSQDSVEQVLAVPKPPKVLWVRWPGGAETRTTIPNGAEAIAVNARGQLVQKETGPVGPVSSIR